MHVTGFERTHAGTVRTCRLYIERQEPATGFKTRTSLLWSTIVSHCTTVWHLKTIYYIHTPYGKKYWAIYTLHLLELLGLGNPSHEALGAQRCRALKFLSQQILAIGNPTKCFHFAIYFAIQLALIAYCRISTREEISQIDLLQRWHPITVPCSHCMRSLEPPLLHPHVCKGRLHGWVLEFIHLWNQWDWKNLNSKIKKPIWPNTLDHIMYDH